MPRAWTRRQFLGSTVGGLTLAACGAPLADTADPPVDPCCQPCSDAELEALVEEISTTDRMALLGPAVDHLARGVSIDDLAYAAVIAGLRASSLTGHSNHPVKAVESARVLAHTTSGLDRFVALLWAIDGVAPYPSGIRNPRDTGGPIGPLDEDGLPDGSRARAWLDDALNAFDRTEAQRGIVALFRGAERAEVVDALCHWGGRNIVNNGHWGIAVAQYLRMLEVGDWRCADVVLRHLAATLATEHDAGSRGARGERAYRANQAAAAEIRDDWETLEPDDAAAVELLHAMRGFGQESASARAAELIEAGVGVQSIWDATLLRAAEVPLYSGDEHAVTSTIALHDLFRRAERPQDRLVLTLQAAACAAAMAGEPWPSQPHLGIDKVEPAEPPDTADELVSSGEPLDRAAWALGWLAAGRSEADLVDAVNRRVVQEHSEWHGYKVPVASNEAVAAASPRFAPRLRAAHAVAYSRGAGRWERYDEARRLLGAM